MNSFAPVEPISPVAGVPASELVQTVAGDLISKYARYRKNHPDKVREAKRLYRQQHAEEIKNYKRDYNRAYRLAKAAHLKELNRKKYLRHRDKRVKEQK